MAICATGKSDHQGVALAYGSRPARIARIGASDWTDVAPTGRCRQHDTVIDVLTNDILCRLLNGRCSSDTLIFPVRVPMGVGFVVSPVVRNSGRNYSRRRTGHFRRGARRSLGRAATGKCHRAYLCACVEHSPDGPPRSADRHHRRVDYGQSPPNGRGYCIDGVGRAGRVRKATALATKGNPKSRKWAQYIDNMRPVLMCWGGAKSYCQQHRHVLVTVAAGFWKDIDALASLAKTHNDCCIGVVAWHVARCERIDVVQRPPSATCSDPYGCLLAGTVCLRWAAFSWTLRTTATPFFVTATMRDRNS